MTDAEWALIVHGVAILKVDFSSFKGLEYHYKYVIEMGEK